MAIRAAARGLCDLIWLVDGADASVAAMMPLLTRFGAVVDTAGLTVDAAARALAAHRPDGLASFHDTAMERVALIAAEAGLDFQTPQAALNLEDKLHQRRAFS